MGLDASDWLAIGVTLRLAAIVTILLMIIGTAIAWWLARSNHWWMAAIEAVVSLPLVLPPTVLGFYLLLAMGPRGPIGAITDFFGLPYLPFTFSGLVFASALYSLPFVVRPIQTAFEAIGVRPLEVAATLGAGPMDTFFSVVLPMARPAMLTAALLGFAHTLGEFGIVLMMGGNIPGVTRVISVHIYDHVEAMDYGRAHALSAVMLVFSFVVLFVLQVTRHRGKGQVF